MSIRAVVLATLVAGLAASCGGSGGGDACPAGERLVDGRCRPALVTDTGSPREDTRSEVSPADVPAGDAAPALADGGEADGVPDGGAVDVPPPRDIPEPTGAVGDPCRRQRDCLEDLECLSWTGGYCTRYDCDQFGNACPAGSDCLPLVDNAFACFRSCTNDDDCRYDDPRYACKTVDDGAGASATVCHEVEDNPGGYSRPCDGHAACAGDLACVRSLPGGACLPLFCDQDDRCAQRGGECVRFDGLPICLVACDRDADCAAVGDGTLASGTARDFDNGREVDVCVSSQADLRVGEACLADNECDSRTCEELGTGRCSFGDPALPCHEREDCWPGGDCIATAPIAICSRACGPGVSCPAGSRCVSRDGATGMCRPPCSPSAAQPCAEGTGWTCVYGAPLGDDASQGHVCRVLRPGEIGTPCTDARDCRYDDLGCHFPSASGTPPDDTEGLCSRTCGPSRPCPFGTYCPTYPGSPGFCQRLCLNAADCPAGHTCETDEGGRTACVLP